MSRCSLWVNNKNDARYYRLPSGEKGRLVNQLLEEHFARVDAEFAEAGIICSCTEASSDKMVPVWNPSCPVHGMNAQLRVEA